MKRRDFSNLIELGRGAQSVVYRARQRSIDRPVVLKRMRYGSAAERSALRDHISALASASIPVSAAVYGMFVHKSSVWVVEESLDGVSLAEAESERWTAALKLYFSGMLVAALGNVHKAGWAHGDIKPSNILLTARGDIRFIDFGLAHPLPADGMSDGQLLLRGGTPDYLAPEVSLPRPYDYRKADIYSIAVLIDKLMKAPANGLSRTLSELLPESTGAALAGALSVDPARRPASAFSLAKPFYDAAAALGLRGEQADREFAVTASGRWRAVTAHRYIAAVDELSHSSPGNAYRVLCELLEIEPDCSEAVSRLELLPSGNDHRRRHIYAALGAVGLAAGAAAFFLFAMPESDYRTSGLATVASADSQILFDAPGGTGRPAADAPLMEPPAETTVRGVLRLTGVPEGARVLVDRIERRLEHPCDTMTLSPGDHVIHIRNDSNVVFEKSVRIFPLAEAVIAVDCTIVREIANVRNDR